MVTVPVFIFSRLIDAIQTKSFFVAQERNSDLDCTQCRSSPGCCPVVAWQLMAQTDQIDDFRRSSGKPRTARLRRLINRKELRGNTDLMGRLTRSSSGLGSSKQSCGEWPKSPKLIMTTGAILFVLCSVTGSTKQQPVGPTKAKARPFTPTSMEALISSTSTSTATGLLPDRRRLVYGVMFAPRSVL